MTSSPNDNGMVPQLNPQTAQDWAAYENAINQYGMDLKDIQKLAAMLVHAKNQFGYNMYMLMEVEDAVNNKGGDQVGILSATENFDTDLRNLLQDAQNNYNGLLGSNTNNADEPTPQEEAMAEKFKQDIDQIQAILDWQGSSTCKNPIIDKGTIDNISSAIKNIKDACGTYWNDAPGAPPGSNLASNILQAVSNQNGGQYSPMLKGISDGLQTVNQSVSALSTSTNTKLQFQSEQYKQGLSQLQAVIESETKLTAAMIQNEKSS
jgi:hypothetical protein